MKEKLFTNYKISLRPVYRKWRVINHKPIVSVKEWNGWDEYEIAKMSDRYDLVREIYQAWYTGKKIQVSYVVKNGRRRITGVLAVFENIALKQ